MGKGVKVECNLRITDAFKFSEAKKKQMKGVATVFYHLHLKKHIYTMEFKNNLFRCRCKDRGKCNAVVYLSRDLLLYNDLSS